MAGITHGNGPNSGFDSPVASTHLKQGVTNESWPFSDSKGRHARGIDDQPADKQLDVTVRIVFNVDGETFLPARAVRWNRSHVCVTLTDVRLSSPYLWVRAQDVRRR